MATGNPQDLAAAIRAGGTEGPLRTLTSDSTRRDGVVAAPDLAQTALDFAGIGGVSDPGGAGSTWSMPRPRSASSTATSSRSG